MLHQVQTWRAMCTDACIKRNHVTPALSVLPSSFTATSSPKVGHFFKSSSSCCCFSMNSLVSVLLLSPAATMTAELNVFDCLRVPLLALSA